MNSKTIIKNFLTNKPELRDSDNKLIARYWFEEMKKKGINPKEMSGYEMLCLFAESKLTSPETIHRMRRKLQEAHSELRGDRYTERKGTIQNQWKKDLGYETD
jgi:hypothetical protein